MITTEQQSNGGKKSKGVRKDAISHGLYASVMAVGGFPAYFAKLYKLAPTKHADLIAKYIPAEIEQSVKVEHNVLVVNMPEPRQVLDIPCEVRAIDSEPPVVKAETVECDE